MKIRDFVSADEPELVRLLAIGRPPGYAEAKAKLFSWQFRRNPHDPGVTPFLVGELDGQIVALNGLMPARVRVQGARYEACWSCDTYVSPQHRGHGLGKQLIARVSAMAPVMLGYGISDMSDPIFDKQGWARHESVQLVFCHVSERGVKGAIKNVASRLRALGSHVTDDVEQWDKLTWARVGEIDALWARSAPGYPSTVERDGAYLRWKYFEHPLMTYRAYALWRRGTLRAVMIARHEPVESVIADYCGPADDGDAMVALAAEVVRDVAAGHTARIKCESTHPLLVTSLRRAGFIGSPYQSRFRVHAPGIANALDGWLLTPGDSDGDLMPALPVELARAANV